MFEGQRAGDQTASTLRIVIGEVDIGQSKGCFGLEPILIGLGNGDVLALFTRGIERDALGRLIDFIFLH